METPGVRKEYRLTFANTLHPHKLSRTATWYAPNGQVHNQIDFKRFTKSPRIRFEKLKDTKTAEVFQAKVGRIFAALCILDSDIDTLATSLKGGATRNS